MSSELKAQLTSEMKVAMKAKEKARLGVIRSMLAAIKQVEIDSQATLEDDAAVLAILDKMLKQRRDSQKQYEDAGRPELAEQEAYEITVIQDFLPQPLTDAEVSELVEAAIEAVSAASMQDMGKVMAILKPKMQGRADMAVVSKIIKAKLS
ncbi:MAG: glutamyl-tRNA amidotransferase [Piscirickettsiaceae bacterium CG_4_9_14_3_um_filter_43_564]|nr:GatB/YqeY domain-containing protein [Thiomicrospira sp.]PIQ03739.1 MAG: glutamyl-tRNA amidotransferase [Piscirickettsiaceae bacterium CG18_big_fil_WC_8_21_14_2_50_44_103]PIU39079.1 MAG: glutamyl-tRNA amidotransferase [Piscirickettsiaceae bacterium CG07_land_8_20_14_0_80_44_28]PIW57042.1 MAG: glutamyl-tRNA amidotransferase [Piscirickettsiaceae bacterium CG12_big_fil_rev_8_21_14_0_65_44_934]PIW77901.1 MAG: glutamyl-tRNA amidotransferase [Piscirickettsiaceae bacterium CG_4_8_14_3_um_filter_44_3